MVIIGFLIAAIPIAGQLYTKYQEDRMMEEWLNSIDASELEDVAQVDTEAAYALLQDAFGAVNEAGDGEGVDAGYSADTTGGNTGSLSGQSGTGDGDGVGSIGSGGSDNAGAGGSGSGSSGGNDGLSGQKVLGIIQIKKIKVSEPIVAGVSKSNLRAGIGHIPGTAAPGQSGNCALAGHRNYAFKKLFSRLDELKAGDEVRITTKKEDLTYKVTETKEVTPDDVSVLKGSKDRSIITLITCTPKYVASHRLIVTAELTGRVLREP